MEGSDHEHRFGTRFGLVLVRVRRWNDAEFDFADIDRLEGLTAPSMSTVSFGVARPMLEEGHAVEEFVYSAMDLSRVIGRRCSRSTRSCDLDRT